MRTSASSVGPLCRAAGNCRLMIPNKEAKGRVTDDSLMPARFTETFQRRRISQPDDAVLTTGEDTRTVGTEGCSPGRWAKRFADPLATH